MSHAAVFMSKPLNLETITRRDFLAATAAGSAIVATTASGCKAPSPIPDVRVEGLADDVARSAVRMARLLYPHDALSDTTYADVVQGVVSASEALTACFEALNAARSTDWLGLGEDDQIAVMQEIEDSPSFATVQYFVRVALYNHRDLWKVIRYPGSSLEFGGYIDRGFDDIDWLPEDD